VPDRAADYRNEPGLSVIGYGMWTAIGHDGPTSIAGMRAGLSGAALAHLRDPASGDALNAFRVAAHQWWEGPTFLPELAAPVIEECLEHVSTLPAGLRRKTEEIPILVAIAPKHRPGRPADLEQVFLDDLARILGRPLPEGSVVVGSGRAGLVHLLARAASQKQRHRLQILVGVESFIRQLIVDHYVDRNRLLCSVNTSGFIPGEAATAVLVAPTGSSRRSELAITGMGIGHEPSLDGGGKEQALTGDGLTQAMRAALEVAGREFYDIPVVMSDLNGEHFKFKEAMIAAMRLDRVTPEGRSRRPREHVEHWNVVETIGEVGAALMPAALGWAFEAGRSGYLPHGRLMAHAGEDDGWRVALVAEMAAVGK
jgi:3-oxoacyl-[acyl-carrier-protein] synthase I